MIIERNIGCFTLKRTGGLSTLLKVYYELGGTASEGLDYKHLEGVAVIPAEASSAVVHIVPLADEVQEEAETVILTVKPEAAYQVGTPNRATVTIAGTVKPPDLATLQIVSPVNGAVFTAPANVEIQAVAVDPKGYINRVEFWAGDRRLGVSEIVFAVAPEPGTPIQHSFTWTNAPVGTYGLFAQATDSRGSKVISPRVEVQVKGETPLPVVTAEATDPEATEPNGMIIERNIGCFTLKRTGGLSTLLKVYYELGGTASNGLDYKRLEGVAVIPAEAASVIIHVLPLPDDVQEEAETVILTVKPEAAYQVGDLGSAKVVIQPPSLVPPPAALRIASPASGAQFVAPANLEIRVTAVDPKGYISQVDFYAGDKLIGASRLEFFAAPEPGTPVLHTFLWEQVGPGVYVLTARATDSTGQNVVSEPVRILVGEAPPPAIVVRNLPEGYLPGVALTVTLEATPPAGTKAYAVEDIPPLDWNVSDISHEGAFDPWNRKVKFGPFTDDQSRTLTYKTTPPNDADGPKKFEGFVSLAGANSPVGGDRLLESLVARHPADLRPADQRLTMAEVAAYAAAWKANEAWPADPNPIPMDYVSRAAALWKGGELYRCDLSIEDAPLCWVNAEGGQAQRAGAVVGSPVGGLAMRELAQRTALGELVTVKVRVLPAAHDLAYAVEERPPAGWQVSAVSDEGVREPVSGRIRWGPFADSAARELTYQLSPTSNAGRLGEFGGAASFDGRSVTISGLQQAIVAGEESAAAWPWLSAAADGSVELCLQAKSGNSYVIEVSTDLVSWTPVATVAGAEALLSYVDAEARNRPRAFYRAVVAR
jgi:hypothetical protein